MADGSLYISGMSRAVSMIAVFRIYSHISVFEITVSGMFHAEAFKE